MRLENRLPRIPSPAQRGTAAALLADIRDLAPAIAARAAEIEAGRRMPLDLVETLRSIGLFRMFVPESHGGLELDLPAGLAVITALARIDGSVGWTAMIASGGAILAPSLPPATYDEIYADGPDVIFAGSAQPAGTAERAEGGWLVTGRWPFASGCQHADWIFGLCVMTEDGTPLPGPAEGVKLLRFAAMPAGDWRIEDTWHVAGLKGTGSHHVALGDRLVPAANFADIAGGVPRVPGALYAAPHHFIPLLHSAMALGIAESALDDIAAMARTGRRQQRAGTAMRDSELFQVELGRAEADARAARALLEVQAASHWRHALAGTLKDEALLTEGTQTSVWIAATCLRVADACFALGGGSALYDSSPLQRRMRDLHVAAQHAAVAPRHYAASGALCLGLGSRSARIGD